MAELNFVLLKKTLRFDVVVPWLEQDCTDDFFPDPIGYKDITQKAEQYLLNRQHRILSFEQIGLTREHVPKKNLMLRESVQLHPIHRLLYLSILHYLIPKLDHRFLHGVYSYRHDQPLNPEKYPFGRKMHRWKEFHNDFRSRAMEPNSGAVLLTDLSSFYDHISCEQLCDRIRSLLGASVTETDDQVIQLLLKLLKQWSTDGFGIPQNMDPSNLFGSLYLHNVDAEMTEARFQYFRWVDDMRIVAKNRDQAVRALHHLQKECEKYRLFLASDKTEILTRDSEKYEKLLDVSDDELLSQAEDLKNQRNCVGIAASLDLWFERLEFHAGAKGDDRKFRAFANRILDASDFPTLKAAAFDRLVAFVLPRFESNPERSDQWAKMLSGAPSALIIPILEKLLIDSVSIFDWQRFYLWRLTLTLEKSLPPRLLEKAIDVASSTISEAVSSQAIVVAGKYGTNIQREQLFLDHFKTQRSYSTQRAVLIALQELPAQVRDRFYRRGLDVIPEHKELVEYLQGLEYPDYGVRSRSEKVCREGPADENSMILRGVGLVGGKVRRFRLSYADYDYD